MKTIKIRTRKFKNALKRNAIYYCIVDNTVREVKLLKATMTGYCTSFLHYNFEYEIAGLGKKNSKEKPKFYNTVEDAINEKHCITSWLDPSILEIFWYCEKKHLLRIKDLSNIYSIYYTTVYYKWNGYKPIAYLGGVDVTFDYLSGEITIEYEDDCYLSQKECEEANQVKCVTFKNTI